MRRISWIAGGVLLCALLSACNLPGPPAATELPADPTATVSAIPNDDLQAQATAEEPTAAPSDDLAAGPGQVTGQLCYPSEFIPPMTLHFLEIGSEALTSVEHLNGEPSYSQSLPAGSYYAFALRSDVDLNGGGAYTQYVACGANENCTDHSLLAFQVAAGQQLDDIDICDWVLPLDQLPPVPELELDLAAQPSATATAPANGISLNCDGTYQRLRVVDNGPDGKTAFVDNWQNGGWVNAWSKTPQDPFLQQMLDEVGWYQFGECQKLVIVPIRNGDPRVTVDLTIHAWNGATMSQVYSNSGWYGTWSKIGDIIRTREASKLGYVDGGPLSACEWLTLEYTWDGTSFNQTGSSVEVVENCDVSITNHP